MSAPHQNILLRALPADACLTLDELAPLVAFCRKALTQALAKLVTRRLVERIERGCYRLTVDGQQAVAAGIELTCAPQSYNPPAIRRNTLRQRVWNAARMQTGSFTAGDLARLAAKEELSAEPGASFYLRALAKAGYLRRLPKRKLCDAARGAVPIRYALIRNTGPIAPVVNRAQGSLRDPNTGEVVPCRL